MLAFYPQYANTKRRSVGGVQVLGGFPRNVTNCCIQTKIISKKKITGDDGIKVMWT